MLSVKFRPFCSVANNWLPLTASLESAEISPGATFVTLRLPASIPSIVILGPFSMVKPEPLTTVVLPDLSVAVKPSPVNDEVFPAVSVVVTPAPLTTVVPAASAVVTLSRSVRFLSMFTTMLPSASVVVLMLVALYSVSALVPPPIIPKVSPNFLETEPLFPAKFNGVVRTSLIASETLFLVVPPILPEVNVPSGLTVTGVPIMFAVEFARLPIANWVA